MQKGRDPPGLFAAAPQAGPEFATANSLLANTILL
jgi:hypothetical protein